MDFEDSNRKRDAILLAEEGDVLQKPVEQCRAVDPALAAVYSQIQDQNSMLHRELTEGLALLPLAKTLPCPALGIAVNFSPLPAFPLQ